MDLGLKDLKALVTGASQGLGFATALELSREGALVTINSRDAERLERSSERIRAQTGGALNWTAGDLGDPDMPGRIVAEAAQAFGGLDLLVTNAGGPPAGNFEAFDDATWQKAIDLSFLGHVRLIRAALPYLRQSSAASVLTVTSLSVKQPVIDLILSNSVRSATIGLTKSLALEFGGDGIRFNSILPSWTHTERVDTLMAKRANGRGTSVEEELSRQSRDSAARQDGRT